jgi:hypothetical protein
MEYIITEKQLKLILSNEVRNKEIDEQTESEPVSSEPTAGTSSTQSGGQGYPTVGKWESGVTRGPANQIGVTKWSDIVGSTLKRGKGNPLKEQVLTGIATQGDMSGYEGAANLMKENPHIVNDITAFAVAALTIGSGGTVALIGVGVAGAIGLYDAYLYDKEGDRKTATLVAFFSLIPFVSQIPGVKELGKTGMSKLAVKVSKNIKLTRDEMRIVVNINKNLNVIKPKIQKIRSNVLAQLGVGAASYEGADMGYDKFIKKGNPSQPKNLTKIQIPKLTQGYDYNKRKQEEDNIKKLDLLIQQYKNKKNGK